MSAGGAGWSATDIAALNISGFQAGSTLGIDTTGGSTTVTGAITGNETLLVQGGNVLTLTQNNPYATHNTYTGGTVVNSGTLALGAGSANGIIRGNLTINSAGTVNATNYWSLGYGDSGGLCVTGIAINGGALAFTDASGGGFAASTVAMTGGTISAATTTIDVYDSQTNTPTLTTYASTATALINCGLNLRLTRPSVGYLTFDVAQGSTGGPDLLVNGPITTDGAGEGVVKTGPGALYLPGANTYTGGTTVNGGTLALGPNTVGSATGMIQGNLTINAGGTLSTPTGWSLGYSNSSGNRCVTAIAINGGVLNFTGAAGAGGTSAGTIAMTGGTISGSAFDLYQGITTTPTLTTNASTATAVISSGFDLRLGGNYVTFNVGAGTTGGADLLISGPITQGSNSGYAVDGIVKTGLGLLSLTGTNSYGGTTTVSNGILQVGSTASLPNWNYYVSPWVIVNPGGHAAPRLRGDRVERHGHPRPR